MLCVSKFMYSFISPRASLGLFVRPQKENPLLQDLMVIGNPFNLAFPDRAKQREEVFKNCPPICNLDKSKAFTKLDGAPVGDDEVQRALGLAPPS